MQNEEGMYTAFAGTPFEREFPGTEDGFADAIKYRDDVLENTPRLTEFPSTEAGVWSTAPVGTRYIVEDERGQVFMEHQEEGWALAVEDAEGNWHSRHVADDGTEVDVVVSGYDGSIISETVVRDEVLEYARSLPLKPGDIYRAEDGRKFELIDGEVVETRDNPEYTALVDRVWDETGGTDDEFPDLDAFKARLDEELDALPKDERERVMRSTVVG